MPVFRIAMKVHDSNHQDFILPQLVDDTVRKPIHDATARILAERLPGVRVAQDQLQGGPDFTAKLLAEPRTF